MKAIATWIVAGGFAWCAYTYAGYPLVLWLLTALRRRRRVPEPVASDWPRISITIPVHNEEAMIGATLDALLALEYPAGRRQVLVVSDASTDGTDDIVASYADRGVELLRLPRRAGKTAAENAALDRLTGEIVVNTDGSVRIDRGALKALARAFADPSVGVASARDVSVARGRVEPNVGERSYVGYEMWLRDLETRLDGIVGASGCCYAIRAHLHHTRLPYDLSRDFAVALIARQAGYRAVTVPEAVCYVPRVGSLGREYARKVRTVARGLRTLLHYRGLLNPFRYGLFGWMLASHKLCRWLAPWALAAGAVALALLTWYEPCARWIGVAGTSLLLGMAGSLWSAHGRVPRLLAIAAYGIAGQVAVLHAWLLVVRGRRFAVWEPSRRDALTTPPAPAASREPSAA